jgi:hypothetical protein
MPIAHKNKIKGVVNSIFRLPKNNLNKSSNNILTDVTSLHCDRNGHRIKRFNGKRDIKPPDQLQNMFPLVAETNTKQP